MSVIDWITSIKDLRSISFADLFYEVMEADDRDAFVKNVIENLGSGYVFLDMPKTDERQSKLLALKDKLLPLREKRVARKRFIEGPAQKEPTYTSIPEIDEILRQHHESMVEHDRWRREMHLKIEGNPDFFEEFLEERSYKFQMAIYSMDMASDDWEEEYRRAFDDPDAEVGIEKIQFDRIIEDAIGKRADDERFLKSLVFSDDVYNRVMGVIDQSRQDVPHDGTAHFIDALLLLPKLKDDQDMIVFFGRCFKKTFEDVNAYTGLLYAYEYFECSGLV